MNKIKGMIFVSIGAASYGILATIIKLANHNNFGTAGLTFLQYLFGVLVLSIATFVINTKSKKTISTTNTANQTAISTAKYPRLKLIFFGTSLGLTSSFYYLSIQYVPLSVGIILLMQTVWMGILLEFFIDRKLVSKAKIIGSIMVLLGTLLASKVFESDFNLNFMGFLYGFSAAIFYTASMYASNKISLELPSLTRSKYLVYGGFLAILIFWNFQIIEEVNSVEILKWGMVLGLFGTVLPPILFSKGVPAIGNGLTSIIAALEIPISVLSAFLILNEQIGFLQGVGIIIILATILFINVKKKK
ncbi:EamA family transporter [Tenacibaculum finnmarkense]|uniref:EamA family transporter n=1 Tax=Tenacibaculum finnmarkense TaxID=2781243 RepID=UPI001EFA9038|nr:DMT family transporter [Tenacibaculum finnmarkense]MCG8730719.1 EamA family transporter [Tenacibaculum finnmarkense]MCG8772332.1 EamA family transporter [Tenacibaculum finnmarkense]MCG8835107.1 EamA family transporter [Tenacibaculum finnmarkense]MCG8893412.1 EamA family transporter [Tenacibaculum finnmarkense]MCG8901903.1 EamA family transporter [Tenacibaculum finnmarkense]